MTPDMITSLVNLGSAGAVIIVVILFLKNIKERDDDWRSFFTELNRQNCADNAGINSNQKSTLDILAKLVDMLSKHDQNVEQRMESASIRAQDLLVKAAEVAAKKVLDRAQELATQPRKRQGPNG